MGSTINELIEPNSADYKYLAFIKEEKSYTCLINIKFSSFKSYTFTTFNITKK